MAIDVLQTNALRQQNQATRDQIVETRRSAISGYNAFLLKSTVPTPACFCCAYTFVERPTGTVCTLLVGCVRCQNDPDNTFYSYARCGVCCAWTVPAGVTKAQFELWGPGSATGSGCCCGGSIHGPHGAYASIMIDVVPGCTYTVCAGCAICCLPVWSFPAAGSPSYVAGYGLCNFCAEGGTQNMPFYICQFNGLCDGKFASGDGGCQRYGTYNCARPCIVNTNDYCFDGSHRVGEYNCRVWHAYYDHTRTYYGSSPTTPSAKLFGVSSLWSCWCIDTSNYKSITVAPVMGYPQVGTCSYSMTTGNCCGGACNGVNNTPMPLPFPSVGGFASHAMSGGTTNCGDIGRGGQVRITYC